MQIIKKLYSMIEDEIADADKYARCSLNYKEEMPELADLFNRLSKDELEHMSMLHEQVVKIIDKYRKEHGEPPESMMALYDYLHEKQIDRSAEVKALQAMYR